MLVFVLISVSDADAVAMSRHLVLSDGLFLGSSSACNLVACVAAVRAGLVPKGGTIVTILCDSGSRHYSKVCLGICGPGFNGSHGYAGSQSLTPLHPLFLSPAELVLVGRLPSRAWHPDRLIDCTPADWRCFLNDLLLLSARRHAQTE